MKSTRVFKNTILAFIALLAFSCGVPELDSNDYLAYIKNGENGLSREKIIGEVIIEVQYIPVEYMAYQESKGVKEEYRSILTEIEGMSYYKVKLNIKKNIPLEEYLTSNGIENPLYYLSYGFEKEIYLEKQGVKESVKLFHFERSNGLSTNNTFMIGFENADLEEKTLVIDAEGLNTGPIKIVFKKEDLNNIPKLRIG